MRLLTSFVTPCIQQGTLSSRATRVLCTRRPLRTLHRLRMATGAEGPLPTTDALKSADLMQSVDHARTLLLTPRSEETKSLMKTMLGSSVGARGFFISLLTDPDIEAVGGDGVEREVERLVKTAAGEDVVSDLIVKNAVMPATMVVAYTREGKKEEAESSRRTMERALKLLGAIVEEGGNVESKLKNMRMAMENPDDKDTEYSAFVKKWGYDAEQRKAAAAAIATFC